MALGKNVSAANAATPTATTTRSPYDKLATTEVTQRGNYIQERFHGLLRVDSFRKGSGFKAGPMFIGNLTVVHLFGDSSTDNPVGQEVTEVLKESNPAFMPRMRAFIDAAGGLTQEDWDSQGGGAIVKEASGESQPLANAVVEARAVRVVKQKAISKPQSELLPDDTYTRVDYLRGIPATEVKKTLTAEVLSKFFPDIETMIANEA